jgi:O-antigen ligase
MISGVVAVFVIDPLYQRLAQSSADFFISGGRNIIWEVGLQLSLNHPFGIGFDNSPLMRQFALEIPHELKHFHSNPINILAETGWIGFILHYLWFFSILGVGLRYHKQHSKSEIATSRLVVGLLCGLLGWQVAGLVEYNFGDSEVVMIAFAMVGILLGITRSNSNF